MAARPVVTYESAPILDEVVAARSPLFVTLRVRMGFYYSLLGVTAAPKLLGDMIKLHCLALIRVLVIGVVPDCFWS